jgi:hypothetical protein
MARPRLNSVDYFPHFVNWGKTIPILEARFGNDGYAVWFKLLESLGRANGHYIDCADANEWEFLLSKFRVSDETALEILNKLADLGAIDRDLWTMEKVIWSDNFVCHLEYLYKKRKEDAPKRPCIRSFRDGNPTCDVVSGAETPQSIAQHSIAEERKAEKEEQLRPVEEKKQTYDPIDMERAQRLKAAINAIDPSYFTPAREKRHHIEKWANTFRMIRKIDERSDADIECILNNITKRGFWSDQVKSPESMRGDTNSGKDRFLEILRECRGNEKPATSGGIYHRFTD